MFFLDKRILQSVFSINVFYRVSDGPPRQAIGPDTSHEQQLDIMGPIASRGGMRTRISKEL